MAETGKIKVIRTALIGAAMGVANIIPGVSGGTIAVVFGIYEYLMEALGNFITDKQRRWEYIRFLVILFMGTIVSIAVFAKLLKLSFEYYPMPTVYLFIGLILGSIPVVLKSYSDMKLNTPRAAAFGIGLVLVVLLAVIQGSGQVAENGSGTFSALPFTQYMYLIFCGAIAASAMIIPGVSGSFILILLGTYWTVLSAVSGFVSLFINSGFNDEIVQRAKILVSVLIGVVAGILVFSKIMNWALKHYPAQTMYAILGLIIGSLYQIYPGFTFDLTGLVSILMATGGFLVSIKFSETK